MENRASKKSSSNKLFTARQESVFNLPTTLLIFILICFSIHFIRSHVLTEDQNILFIMHLAFIPLRYSLPAFWADIWSYVGPITYSFLHGSYPHLIMNMAWLVAVGTPLAQRIGLVRLILFSLFTGMGAAGIHYLMNPDSFFPLIGASGIVSGMMAVAPRFLFRVERFSFPAAYAGSYLPLSRLLRERVVLIFLVCWMGGNFLIGMMGIPGVEDIIAWEAHIGGFLSGFIFFPFFDRQYVSST